MARHFSQEDKRLYFIEKLQDLSSDLEDLERVTGMSSLEKYFNGSGIIEDKIWVQLGLGLAKLQKEKEKKTKKKLPHSKSQIIHEVEALDFFSDESVLEETLLEEESEPLAQSTVESLDQTCDLLRFERMSDYEKACSLCGTTSKDRKKLSLKNASIEESNKTFVCCELCVKQMYQFLYF